MYMSRGIDFFEFVAGVLQGDIVKVSKVGDHSRGWPEGSLFDSYYTKV